MRSLRRWWDLVFSSIFFQIDQRKSTHSSTTELPFWRLPPAAISEWSRNKGKNSSDVESRACLQKEKVKLQGCSRDTALDILCENVCCTKIRLLAAMLEYHVTEAWRVFLSNTKYLLSGEVDNTFQTIPYENPSNVWKPYPFYLRFLLSSIVPHMTQSPDLSSTRFSSSSLSILLLHVVLKSRNEHNTQVVAWTRQKTGDHCCPFPVFYTSIMAKIPRYLLGSLIMFFLSFPKHVPWS